MSEQTNSSETPPQTAATQALLADLTKDAAFIRQIVTAVKAGGAQAANPLIPDAVASVERTIQDALVAAPEIRRGYKTTEFWLVVGAVAGNMIYASVTGRPFPLEANATIVAVTGIYTVVRSLIKRQ
jgi:hypothetical protein